LTSFRYQIKQLNCGCKHFIELATFLIIQEIKSALYQLALSCCFLFYTWGLYFDKIWQNIAHETNNLDLHYKNHVFCPFSWSDAERQNPLRKYSRKQQKERVLNDNHQFQLSFLVQQYKKKHEAFFGFLLGQDVATSN